MGSALITAPGLGASDVRLSDPSACGSVELSPTALDCCPFDELPVVAVVRNKRWVARPSPLALEVLRVEPVIVVLFVAM